MSRNIFLMALRRHIKKKNKNEKKGRKKKKRFIFISAIFNVCKSAAITIKFRL